MRTRLKTPRPPLEPIREDFAADSDTLFVAFSGQQRKPELLKFEFVTSSAPYPIKKLFLRDPNLLWYHKGLPRIANNIDEIAAYLRQTIQAQNIRHTIFFGVSGGGYAALLFGALCGATLIHAFTPKTFITPLHRLKIFDLRLRLLWRYGSLLHFRRLWQLQFEPGIQKQYFDLKTVFQTTPHRPEIHIHYCPSSRIDRIHAAHLAELPNLTFHTYPKGGHGLAVYLRQQGTLSQIVQQAIHPFLQAP